MGFARKETEKAKELLTDMISKGLEPDVVTYTLLWMGCARRMKLKRQSNRTLKGS
jgi:pentatricopeptide repeat protein